MRGRVISRGEKNKNFVVNLQIYKKKQLIFVYLYLRIDTIGQIITGYEKSINIKYFAAIHN